MKTTLQIVAGLMFCASTILSAQNATYTAPLHPTVNSTRTIVPSAERSGGTEEAQMVTCADKLTYCDRHPTTVLTAALGGTQGFGSLYQLYPNFTGNITEVYANAATTGGNATIDIAIFPLSGGIPSYNPVAVITRSVTSATMTEYGGALTTPIAVTGGFAIGVYPDQTTDSCNLGCRQDPEQRSNVYYDLGMPPVNNIGTDYGFYIDMLMRPKISFTAPAVSISPDLSSACPGTPITFTDSYSSIPSHYFLTISPIFYNATESYNWNFGDAGTSTLAGPVQHTYAAAGTYNPSLTATVSGWTTNCPLAIATSTVTITGSAASVSIAASANPVCPAGTCNFSATPTNGGSSPSYVWKINNIQVGTGVSFSYSTWNAGDLVTCEMTSNAACAPSSPVVSNSIMMYLQPIAFSSFNYTTTGLAASFTSTAAGALTWSWNFGDAGTSSAPNPVHNYASPGVYTVELTVTNACGQTNISYINITVTSSGNSSGGNTGVIEKELNVNVNAFPNPVNNELNIDYKINHTTDVTIEVVNTLGQVVSTQGINNTSEGTAHLSMENMASGLYFVRFKAGENNVQTMRVVRQ